MTESIITAIITGGIALIGTIITVIASNRKVNQNLLISQAVTDTKIDGLTTEVQKLNDFARDIPVMKERIKNIEHRVENLEQERGL